MKEVSSHRKTHAQTGIKKSKSRNSKRYFRSSLASMTAIPFENFKDHKQRVYYRSKFNISPDE